MISTSNQSNLDVAGTSNFSIEVNSSMFQMLTKNVYNNIVLAPMREWSTNAIDACIAAGVPPHFDVHIPTLEEPYFSVRDYGTGLSKDDILGLFSTFGASTKRDSNAYNGTFGIGRMSGLAYSSSFTVESFKDNQKHSYLISIKDGIPVSVPLESKYTKEPNGLRLSLDVNPQDVARFKQEAVTLYKYFDHKPTINIELPEFSPIITHDDFYLIHGNEQGVVMGNVFYRLDTYRIPVQYRGLILRIPIGSVSITPGRESLTYDQETIEYLCSCVLTAETEILKQIAETIESKDTIIEQLQTYDSLLKQVPYKYQDDLEMPDAPSPASFKDSGRWYSSFALSHPAFYLKVKHPSYKTIRFADQISWGIKEYTTSPHVVVDVRSYGATSDFLSKDYINYYVPKELTKEGIEAALPDIIKYLDDMGITYVKVSDLELPKTERKKSARRNLIHFKRDHYGSAFNVNDKYDADNDTELKVYVPINDDSVAIDCSSAFLNACKALKCHLEYELSLNYANFVGIPPKYLEAAEEHDNFIHFKDYINDLLSKNSVEVIFRENIQKGREYNSLGRWAREFYENTTHSDIPADLVAAFKERKSDSAYSSYLILNETEYNEISSEFSLTKIDKVFKHDFDSLIKQYPLVKALGDNREAIHYYFKLEKLKNDTLHRAK